MLRKIVKKIFRVPEITHIHIQEEKTLSKVKEAYEHAREMEELEMERARCLMDKEEESYYESRSLAEKGDVRYNTPKLEPSANIEDIDKVIASNSIYSEAREELLNAQRRQVGYGMDKYPEPLTADSWTLIETLNHQIE